jgi:hypothetical protein
MLNCSRLFHEQTTQFQGYPLSVIAFKVEEDFVGKSDIPRIHRILGALHE